MAILNKNEKVGRYVVTFFIKQGSYAETYRVKDSLGKTSFLNLSIVPNCIVRSLMKQAMS